MDTTTWVTKKISHKSKIPLEMCILGTLIVPVHSWNAIWKKWVKVKTYAFAIQTEKYKEKVPKSFGGDIWWPRAANEEEHAQTNLLGPQKKQRRNTQIQSKKSSNHLNNHLHVGYDVDDITEILAAPQL